MAAMKAALVVVGALLVGVAAWILLRGHGAADVVPGVSANTPARTASSGVAYAPETVLAIRPGAAPVPRRAEAAPKVSALLQEFYDAKGLRPLYDRLKAIPNRTDEETYLLAAVLEGCATVTDRKRLGPPRNRDEERKRLVAMISEKDPKREQRLAAFDKAQANRCDGFEGVTTTNAEIRELLASSNDPKARARLVEKDIAATLPADGPVGMGPDGQSRLPVITDAQLEVLREALQSRDPAAASIAARIFGTTMRDFTVRAGPNGETVDQRAWSDAWRLVACDLGSPCGRDSSSVLYGCAMQGNCGALDLREHLFFFEHSPQQSQRVADYQYNLMRAIQTGDWSYFDFHRGPGPRNWVAIMVSP